MLLPLLSIHMVKLTMEYAFCEDSIVGLATASPPVVSIHFFFAIPCNDISPHGSPLLSCVLGMAILH